jgi:hypothetical protein
MSAATRCCYDSKLIRTRWTLAAGDDLIIKRRFLNSQQRTMYFVGSDIWSRSASLILFDGFGILAIIQHKPRQGKTGQKQPKTRNFAGFQCVSLVFLARNASNKRIQARTGQIDRMNRMDRIFWP